ncbi:nose resistant to fluoxetine protein 6-like [Argonauta hians]
MKGIVFLFALILPGVVLSVSVETPNYWSILASAVQRYNQGTDDIRNRFYFPNDSDSRVKLDSYSPSLDQMIDKARHLLSQDFCDTVAAYNVSKKCCEDMKIILASLVLREMWAIQSTLSKLLQCFSVYHNGSKLLNTDQGVATLTCIHGIRFLSMTWVLLGHTYVFGSSLFRNPATIMGYLKQFAFQAIGNATVSVDSFFLLSGLLVAYSTLKALDARQGKMNWIYFYVHRYWRLTPPILLVMMVYIPLFRYMGDGPFWPSQGVENNFCRDSWFYNILYINNFLPKNQMMQCMAWLWYLANDMQFYWISPLILIPLFRYPKIGHVIAGVLLLVNFICTGIIATNDHAALSMFTTNQQDIFDDIYVKPYTRIGPYLVGLIVGYHLYKTKCHFKINKYINAMLWLLFTVSALCVLYGAYSSNNGATVSQATASFYTAVTRTVWGMCVGWVVFACCTGNAGYVNTLLSWKGFITLSRLTYCAYLIHPIVFFYFYFSLRYPIAPIQVTFVFLFLGCLGVTFMVATLTSLAFEAPMLGLEKLLLHKLHFTR